MTREGTLSRVMTSCGGMFSVTVRRSTRTIRSITGISRIRPGPLRAIRRPRRKMTPRSYSRRTRIAEPKKNSRKKAATTATPIATAIRSAPFASVALAVSGGADDQRQPVHRLDANTIADALGLPVGDPRLPERALDPDLRRPGSSGSRTSASCPNSSLPAGPAPARRAGPRGPCGVMMSEGRDREHPEGDQAGAGVVGELRVLAERERRRPRSGPSAPMIASTPPVGSSSSTSSRTAATTAIDDDQVHGLIIRGPALRRYFA